MCPMSLITSIKPQKNKSRFNIFIDGKFALGLDAETMIKEGLKENQEISQKDIEKLIKENEFQKLLDKALRFLSYRPRSEKEILDFLVRKQAGEETSKMVMARLKELDMVDDKAFADWWLEQRKTFRPKGKILLKLELGRKGISKGITEQLLEDQGNEDELKVARKLLEKKAGRWQNLPSLEFKKKTGDFLLRRGFTWETVNEAVAKFFKKE